MIKTAIIALSLFGIFYISRHIIFNKKREFKYLRNSNIKNFFIDYYYYYKIKKLLKNKKYYYILSDNKNKIIEKINNEKYLHYNFPDESLFSLIVINSTFFLIINTIYISQEKNAESQINKRRLIKLFKRIRKSTDFYNFKGILSFKDSCDDQLNKNSSDEPHAIVHRDYFIISELNGIYNADIPYYSLLKLSIKGEYSEILNDFKIKESTKIVGLYASPFQKDENNFDYSLNSNYVIECYKSILDDKKFNIVQFNNSPSEISKYIGVVSSLKNGVANCYKTFNSEIEKNLEKYNINLCSAGFFFYNLESSFFINIDNLFNEISEAQFENIRLNKNNFNKYQNIIIGGMFLASISTILLLTGLIGSLINFHKDYKKIEVIFNRINDYNNFSELNKSSSITNITCEIINDAYNLSKMNNNYIFIIPSWKNNSSSSIQEKYSVQFSKFFNKNLIQSFNKYIADAINITDYDDVSNFSNHEKAYLYAADIANKISEINDIYIKLNQKDSDSFSDSINKIIQKIYGLDNNLNQCSSQFSSNSSIATLKSKNFELDLALSHEEFQKKSKEKFDKILEILVTSQFNKKKLDSHAFSLNKLFSNTFKVEQPNFNTLPNEEKYKFIKQIVTDYLALKEFASITSQTTKSVEEFINTNNYNLLYLTLQNSQIINKKDIDFYKKRIEDIFKDFKNIMLTYQIKEFDQKLFLIEQDKSVVIHKDIDFYFSNLSNIINDYSMENPNNNSNNIDTLSDVSYFNIEFLQTILNNTINLDNIINSFKDKKYSPNLQNKIENTLKFIIEIHLINNKNKLFTTTYRSNLNSTGITQEDSIKNLIESYYSLKQMNVFIVKYQLSQIAQTIYPNVYSKLNQSFHAIKEKLLNTGLYVGTTSNFNWWNGEIQAAHRYFGVSTEAELTDYIQKQKNIILKIYNEQVSQLMQIHDELNLTYKDNTNFESRYFWKRIKNDLIEKTELGSISSLNDFVLNLLNKTTTDTCYVYLKSIQSFQKNEDDYFNMIKLNLANKFSNRCQHLYYEKSIIEYKSISKLFNQKLSNKFPFAESNKLSQLGQYALLEDVHTFLQNYALFAKSYLTFLKEYYPSFFTPEFKDFFQKTNKFYNFISSGKDSDGKIKFPIDFNFRTDRQSEVNGNKVLNWKLECGTNKLGSNYGSPEESHFKWIFGDPCKLTLNISKSKTNKILIDDIQNIISDENNPWGMLSLIMRYRDCRDDCDNVSRLKMNLHNAKGENIILFYFNYKIYKNNHFSERINIPKFPVFAPELKSSGNKIIHENVSELPDI